MYVYLNPSEKLCHQHVYIKEYFSGMEKKVSKWNSGDPGRSKDYYFVFLFGS